MASGLCEAKVKGKTVPDFGASEGDGPLSERPSVCRRHTKNRNCQELSKADERVGIYAVIPTDIWDRNKKWSTYFFLTLLFYNCIVPMGFLPWEIRVAFPGKSQLRQSRATQPTVHAGSSGVSIIHRTLTWTTGSLTCAHMLMRAIAHGGVRTHVRESALKVDSGRKNLLPHRGIELASAA